MSGRREQRAEMRRTWQVYVPTVGGRPMSRKDVEDAETRASAEAGAAAAVRDIPLAESERDSGLSVSRNVHLPSLIRVAKRANPLVAVWDRELNAQDAAIGRLIERAQIDGVETTRLVRSTPEQDAIFMRGINFEVGDGVEYVSSVDGASKRTVTAIDRHAGTVTLERQ